MNSSAIWEIIALSHVLEGRVITRGEAEWNLSMASAIISQIAREYM